MGHLYKPMFYCCWSDLVWCEYWSYTNIIDSEAGRSNYCCYTWIVDFDQVCFKTINFFYIVYHFFVVYMNELLNGVKK